MRLNGEQRRRFHKSLLNAFPSKPLLKQMVDFELDENLDAIAVGENHSDTVFELINWARKEGKVKKLLTAARKSNPGNLELRNFEEQMRNNSQSVINISSSNREIPEDDLSSEKGVDYTRLRDLLKAGEWKEADNETFTVMLKAAGKESDDYLYSYDIEEFPCTDLRTIDQLWVKYSNGRFGFSVQKRVWESIGKDYEKFGDRVGWRKRMFGTFTCKFYSELAFSRGAPEGHLPAVVVFGREKICLPEAVYDYVVTYLADGFFVALFSHVQTSKS